MTITKEDIKAMSAKERAELLNTIWDVIEDDPYTDEAGAETMAELNLLQERLEEYKKNPSAAKTWDETYQKLNKRGSGL